MLYCPIFAVCVTEYAAPEPKKIMLQNCINLHIALAITYADSRIRINLIVLGEIRNQTLLVTKYITI